MCAPTGPIQLRTGPGPTVLNEGSVGCKETSERKRRVAEARTSMPTSSLSRRLRVGVRTRRTGFIGDAGRTALLPCPNPQSKTIISGRGRVGQRGREGGIEALNPLSGHSLAAAAVDRDPLIHLIDHGGSPGGEGRGRVLLLHPGQDAAGEAAILVGALVVPVGGPHIAGGRFAPGGLVEGLSRFGRIGMLVDVF